jgi:hypothetical protein
LKRIESEDDPRPSGSAHLHGQAFTVVLKPSGFGTKVLTFGTTSAADAAAWVQAIEAIEASATATRSNALIGWCGPGSRRFADPFRLPDTLAEH